MVIGFTKSEEGLREYSKIGLPYPPELQDELYEDWVRKTSADNFEIR